VSGDIYAKLIELRELVWMQDIPSPTIPEYREHHESIQKILNALDRLIDEMSETDSE
jgi:hypothetical protein